MSTQAVVTSVKTAVVVDAPLERAFDVFTAGMASWWNPDHHIIEAKSPRWCSSAASAATSTTAASTAASAAGRACSPTSLRIAWSSAGTSACGGSSRPTREMTSEVEVRFLAEGAERTRVELEHRHLDRHGEGWEQMRDAVGSPDGWPVGLQRFANHLATG